MKRKNLTFTSVIWKEGKHFVSQCLNADVSSFGKSRAEALKNLEEALGLYFEDAPRRLPEVRYPSVVVRELQHA